MRKKAERSESWVKRGERRWRERWERSEKWGGNWNWFIAKTENRPGKMTELKSKFKASSYSYFPESLECFPRPSIYPFVKAKPVSTLVLMKKRVFTRGARSNVCDSAIEIPYWWRKSMHVAFGWLANARVKKVHARELVEINGYFALMSYCNTIGQSNNAFSILGFSLTGKRIVHVLIFSSIGW